MGAERDSATTDAYAPAGEGSYAKVSQMPVATSKPNA